MNIFVVLPKHTGSVSSQKYIKNKSRLVATSFSKASSSMRFSSSLISLYLAAVAVATTIPTTSKSPYYGSPDTTTSVDPTGSSSQGGDTGTQGPQTSIVTITHTESCSVPSPVTITVTAGGSGQPTGNPSPTTITTSQPPPTQNVRMLNLVSGLRALFTYLLCSPLRIRVLRAQGQSNYSASSTQLFATTSIRRALLRQIMQSTSWDIPARVSLV